MPRIIFFGSSDFSLPALHACLRAPGYELAAVITTPPQKQGRGLHLSPTVVAQACAQKSLLCREFFKLDDAAYAEFEKWQPDVLVVASYGKMIPERFLKLAKHRFNIHPSLLPRHRGASPLNAPFLAGDAVTGLSIADITKELDAGDIFYREEHPLRPEWDSEKLGVFLADRAAVALGDLLAAALHGKIERRPQDAATATYAPKLTKEQGRLSFNDPASKWDGCVRGLKPWPGAFIEVQGERIAVEALQVLMGGSEEPPGKIQKISGDQWVVQTARDAVVILRVKPAGKKTMSGGDYARGKRWQAGIILK